MARYRNHAASLLAIFFGLLATTPARAATPTKVTADWTGGVSGLPSDVTMYSYVPSKVATNPPILTLIHYCGGSATAVFSQATGNGTTNGGVVQAADQYGFIIVVPDNGGRCWDVTSNKTHTRDGGGDSHAIIQMVRYAISQYHANANRVYSTGDSSGAMMTELLLALYPDVYKAGAAFAGVPAGCSNEFDSSGLCGLPTQTAQQWGDRVRAMDQGYSGHRPRVQLFHGDADATITYKNLAQAINEWSNVLGLSTTPTSTTSGLTLGTHQATEQQWKNSCGYVVLDALTSIGGDHGPSDALFESKYVIPFLGLDNVGDTDPEIAQCGGGGTGGGSGTGGATSTGGTTATGGARTGGTSGTGGTRVATGGSLGTGGNTVTGGSSSTGGNMATGGRASGGALATGGAPGSGGNFLAGGKSSTGGTLASGGSVLSGGTGGTSTRPATTSATGGSVASTGGLNGVGGSAAAVGGDSSLNGVGGSAAGTSDNTGSCSCTVAGKAPRSRLLALALAAGLLLRRRQKIKEPSRARRANNVAASPSSSSDELRRQRSSDPGNAKQLRPGLSHPSTNLKTVAQSSTTLGARHVAPVRSPDARDKHRTRFDDDSNGSRRLKIPFRALQHISPKAQLRTLSFTSTWPQSSFPFRVGCVN